MCSQSVDSFPFTFHPKKEFTRLPPIEGSACHTPESFEVQTVMHTPSDDPRWSRRRVADRNRVGVVVTDVFMVLFLCCVRVENGFGILTGVNKAPQQQLRELQLGQVRIIFHRGQIELPRSDCMGTRTCSNSNNIFGHVRAGDVCKFKHACTQ